MPAGHRQPRDSGIGLSQVVSRREQLPFLTVWRMLAEGMYGVALEPSTNRDAGRWDAAERGELQMLEPGEDARLRARAGGAARADELETFEARVAALGPAPA